MTIKTTTEVLDKEGTKTIVIDDSNKLSTKQRNILIRKWFYKLFKEGQMGKEEICEKIRAILEEDWNIRRSQFTIRQIVNGQEERYKKYSRKKITLRKNSICKNRLPWKRKPIFLCLFCY
jgi:hypothetical protein